MAEVADIIEVEVPPSKNVTAAGKHALPIDQRTDVTVDELEKTSLPYPAELYNGKVVFKMAAYAHGKIQTRLGGKLDQYLEQNPIGEAMTETKGLLRNKVYKFSILRFAMKLFWHILAYILILNGP